MWEGVDPDETGAEERHHGHRNDVGRKKRKHHRECESSEHVLADPDKHDDRKEHNAGRAGRSEVRPTALLLPPFSEAVTGSSPISIWRKMFSSTTTELSINRDKARARPPSTMVLMVLPPRSSAIKVARHEIGIDSNTLMVARRLPRKSKIISAVKIRPIVPSLITL